ncbi:MAG: hypothetical protein FJX29_05325 [Alphaproteobacteria bacterium]|nr:hypothetical protein [Alphaproteobacteria bacterium]
MSAITSRITTNTTSVNGRHCGLSSGWLIAAGFVLAPFALVGFGLMRGGIEPYLVLAAWLLG